MKICYTVSDAIQAMVREEICRTVENRDDGYTDKMWDSVKAAFARRWKTKKLYVNITAVKEVPDDYRPIRWER